MTRDQHTPVSNQPEELSALAAEQPLFRPPSEGVQGTAAQPGSSGLEQVEGYRRPEYDTLPPDLWTAPTAALRDIGEASFGPAHPVAETVHGPDDRAQIMDTSIYPWRAHASLLITAADGSRWIGTGWFIGPHTLATAGHVVHIKNSGVPGQDGWVKSIQVMPGRNGTALPFGSVTSTNFRSVRGWTDSGDENYDYGTIIIPTELGSTTGWFGFGAWPDADLLKSVGNISGYPGDKPPGTQWYDGRSISSVNPLKVYYDIDTAGGQSGSAVYRIVNGGRYGIAVHAYGGATTNSGTRITGPVYDNLLSWTA
ncbi:endopeptidase [Streptomyces sp. NBC_01275]|uniref:trypsin-like serine peptidase n=1 Tax=Streptomyces sp. NBC_01275 TaxID=2903807 RepID=UPI0022564DE2|nr:endopeptidase [Streptomyces sp. NBC_01275]MCX4766915.1 endopeptidase [Streptomyces sp. NBC_01275]